MSLAWLFQLFHSQQVFVAAANLRAPGVAQQPVAEMTDKMNFLLEAAYQVIFFK
jgi:hypothetical protein